MPQIFTARGMMRDFFGQNTLDITTIPHDMQISLRESHGEGNIYGQYIIHQKTSHHQFDIFRTL
jgi:hypothetical protein